MFIVPTQLQNPVEKKKGQQRPSEDKKEKKKKNEAMAPAADNGEHM